LGHTALYLGTMTLTLCSQRKSSPFYGQIGARSVQHLATKPSSGLWIREFESCQPASPVAAQAQQLALFELQCLANKRTVEKHNTVASINPDSTLASENR
jgi:hypothetical protein